MNQHSRLTRRTGQSLVEFALSIPLIVLVLVAVLYFARVFYVKQAVLLAAQAGTRALSHAVNLGDAGAREFVAGFSTSGALVNQESVVAGVLGAANLLSEGASGDLPPGASVRVLPWDSDGTAEDMIPSGTIALRIDYPFNFMGNPFSDNTGTVTGDIEVWTGEGGSTVPFRDFTISEKVVALQEVYGQ